MIRVRYAQDAKRRGQVLERRTLAAAKRAVRCARGKKKALTPVKLYGYAHAWELTCGDTVVADLVQLPPRAYPRATRAARRRRRKAR